MQLRPYQIDFKNKVYSAFKEGKQNVLAQLPTGAGKTIIFSSIIKDGYEQCKRLLVLAHRGELITQASDKLYRGFGIASGIIKNGYEARPGQKVQIASVQTLINRKLHYPVDLVIIDEAHHMQGKNSYGKIKEHVLELNPNCKFLGVTATPCRTNGAGFADVFDCLIQGISIKDLIKQGFLSAPRYFVAPLELGKIKISAGDYNIKELSEVYQNKVHPEDLVKNWQKLANGKKTIGFAVDIAHSQRIVDSFNSHGISAAHIDGTTNDYLRRKLIKDFEKGTVKVLYNVGVFDEGFDCSSIEAVQLARPSKSLIKYMQMCGRALRPAEGKEFALILDHSGLITEHDTLEREREWKLQGVVKKETNVMLMYKNKLDGKLYEPEKIPFDIPMQNIELVELTKNNMCDFERFKNIKKEFEKKREIAQRYGFKNHWIWYKMAERVDLKDIDKARLLLNDIASLFCQQYNYKNGYVFHLVNDYLEKNSSTN